LEEYHVLSGFLCQLLKKEKEKGRYLKDVTSISIKWV
jgi:hypothetical protein